MAGAVPVAGVRRASDDDLPTLEAMATRAAASLDGARGAVLLLARETPVPTLEELSEALHAGDMALFAGTLDDVPVGAAMARIEELPAGVRLAVVTFLWVDEDARAVGVGEALLDEVCSWAATNDCGSVDAYALPGERVTKNFFEAAGFKARLLTVHRDL